MSKNDTPAVIAPDLNTIEIEKLNQRAYALEDAVAELRTEIAGARRAQPSLNMSIQGALDSAIAAMEKAASDLEARLNALEKAPTKAGA